MPPGPGPGPMNSYSSQSNYTVVTYKTVNVKPATYERLKTYKVAGKSFDEVLNDLMDEVEPDAFYRDLLEQHRRSVEEMRAGGGIPLEDLDRHLDSADRGARGDGDGDGDGDAA